MSWTIARGRDSGDTVIVSIDEDFRDPTRRGGRDTRISARFLGAHMLKSAENRAAFEDGSFTPMLEKYGGLLVAGITRTRPPSYTFVGYCFGNVEPSAFTVGESLSSICTVTVHHDPEWAEYESWLPQRAEGFARIALFFRSLIYRIANRK